MNRNNLPKPNAKCKICGKPYYRCKRCIELHAAGVFSWRMHCDSYDCFAIYNVLTDVRTGAMTKEQAREILTDHFSAGLIPEMLPGIAEEYAAIMEKPQKSRRKRGEHFENQSVEADVSVGADGETISEAFAAFDESASHVESGGDNHEAI